MASSGVNFTFTFYRVEVGKVVLQGLRFCKVGVIPLMHRICISFVCHWRYTILAIESFVKLTILSPTSTLAQSLGRASINIFAYTPGWPGLISTVRLH
jgi:hypothetical protein